MIRASLNKKLMIVFSSILILVVTLNIAINSQLLPKVYREKKIEGMCTLYDNIYSQYETNSGSDAVIETVNDVLSKENLRVFIWNGDDRLVIDARPLPNENTVSFPKKDDDPFPMHDKRFAKGPFDGKNEMHIYYSKLEDKQIIKEDNNYSVFSFDSFEDLKEKNLYLRGILPNNYKILLQMPYAPIDKAVDISNTLLFFVGMAMLFVGIMVVAVTSKSIARPIKELSDIAKSMENLDFSRKYIHNRHDEIGQLGDSVNSLSSKLECTINELCEKNEKLRQDIELKSRIDNMRKEFIANASHELKTPVALIGGYAEGLRDNIADNEETRKIYTDVIIEETDKMNHIIHQMLDLMEIDGIEEIIDATQFSLADLTEESIINFELMIKSKKIDLEYETLGDCTISGDYWRIHQAVSNYISNAINHVDDKKKIKISVIGNEGHVRLSVYNSGNHIPTEDINNIWERFYKVDKSHTREYGGTGLGLSIVRSVVQLHKGEYGVQNCQDGVEFYFIIYKSK